MGIIPHIFTGTMRLLVTKHSDYFSVHAFPRTAGDGTQKFWWATTSQRAKCWEQKDDFERDKEAPSNTEMYTWLYRKIFQCRHTLLVKASFILYSHASEDSCITCLSSKLNTSSCTCNSLHNYLHLNGGSEFFQIRMGDLYFFILASNNHSAEPNEL